jgi:hypothetical protein
MADNTGQNTVVFATIELRPDSSEKDFELVKRTPDSVKSRWDSDLLDSGHEASNSSGHVPRPVRGDGQESSVPVREDFFQNLADQFELRFSRMRSKEWKCTQLDVVQNAQLRETNTD